MKRTFTTIRNKGQHIFKAPTRLRAQLRGEKGFGTIEVVIIIAIMLAIVLLFRTQISRFASKLIDRVFSDSIIDSL